MKTRCLCRGPKLEKDKGYAWVILFMSFLSHFVHVGFSFSIIGNMTIAHQKFFGIDLQLSSLMGSIHSGLLLLFGPIASVLIKKFGCRFTQLFGGTCAILGVGLSSLSSEPWHAFLLYSILTPIGTSSCYTASSTILSLHFDKFKYFAFPAAMMGDYIGLIVWPITSQYLLDEYKYSKAMGIMSTLHIIHLIAGICFFEPKSKEVLNDSSRDSSLDSDERMSKLGSLSDDEQDQECDTLTTDTSERGLAEDTETELSEKPVADNSLKRDFKMILSLTKVWALMINAFLWSANISSFFILINAFVLKRTGLSAEEVALGITICGATNIIGCLAVIFTGSLRYDRLLLHCSALMLLAITTIVIAFTNTKAMYYVLTAIFGLGHGMTVSNLLGVIHDFCGPRQLPVLLGLHLMAEGLGGLVAVPLYGYITTVSSDQTSMIICGCTGIASIFSILPVIVSNYKDRRKLSRKQRTSTYKFEAPGSDKISGSSQSL